MKKVINLGLKFKVLLLLAFFTLAIAGFNYSYAGACTTPANNSCASAVTLTPGAACTNGLMCDGTTQAGEAFGCAVTAGTATVWYRFTATNTSHNVSITNLLSGGCVLRAAVYNTGTCLPSAASCIGSDNSISATDVIALAGLTVTNSYLIQLVYPTGGPCGGDQTFCISVSGATLPPSCTDGILNQTESAVDCGGVCPPCGAATIPNYCEPCNATGAVTMTAINPTATGVCYTYTNNNTCTPDFQTAGIYGTNCGVTYNFGGGFFSPAVRSSHTWVKVTVPASGEIAGYVAPTSASSTNPEVYLFSGTCSGGVLTGPSLVGCATSFGDGSSGDTRVSTTNGTGIQYNFTGLTAGATLYMLIDFTTPAAGGTQQMCFFSGETPSSANFIGGAASTCGTTVTGSSVTSINELSMCDGYTPDNCSGGPAPSFENVSMYMIQANSSGSDMTVSLDPTSCLNSTSGLQMLVYSQGTITGCSGGTPICDVGTCTLGSCVGGNTASGMGTKTATIAAPPANAVYYILVDGFAGALCDFTLNSTGCTVLPVALVNFNAKRTNKSFVKLTWNTMSERNNDYFIVERSLDGANYVDAGYVDGFGNSSEKLDYEFIDESTNEYTSYYYRLRQVDYDGQTSYSQPTYIYSGNLKPELFISPNPTDNDFSVSFYSKENYEAKIYIYNNVGQVVKSLDIVATKGNNEFQVNLNELNSGLYTCVLVTGGDVVSAIVSKF